MDKLIHIVTGLALAIPFTATVYSFEWDAYQSKVCINSLHVGSRCNTLSLAWRIVIARVEGIKDLCSDVTSRKSVQGNNTPGPVSLFAPCGNIRHNLTLSQNSQSAWTIQVPEQFHLNVTIRKIYLVYSFHNCQLQSLSLSQGYSKDSFQLTLCGHQSHVVIPTYTSNISIVLTDNIRGERIDSFFSLLYCITDAPSVATISAETSMINCYKGTCKHEHSIAVILIGESLYQFTNYIRWNIRTLPTSTIAMRVIVHTTNPSCMNTTGYEGPTVFSAIIPFIKELIYTKKDRQYHYSSIASRNVTMQATVEHLVTSDCVDPTGLYKIAFVFSANQQHTVIIDESPIVMEFPNVKCSYTRDRTLCSIKIATAKKNTYPHIEIKELKMATPNTIDCQYGGMLFFLSMRTETFHQPTPLCVEYAYNNKQGFAKDIPFKTYTSSHNTLSVSFYTYNFHFRLNEHDKAVIVVSESHCQAYFLQCRVPEREKDALGDNSIFLNMMPSASAYFTCGDFTNLTSKLYMSVYQMKYSYDACLLHSSNQTVANIFPSRGFQCVHTYNTIQNIQLQRTTRFHVALQLLLQKCTQYVSQASTVLARIKVKSPPV